MTEATPLFNNLELYTSFYNGNYNIFRNNYYQYNGTKAQMNLIKKDLNNTYYINKNTTEFDRTAIKSGICVSSILGILVTYNI
jgi:hypothetical protein